MVRHRLSLPGAAPSGRSLADCYGIHTLESDAGFSVVVVGYDSYAYLGGSGTGKINPNPPG